MPSARAKRLLWLGAPVLCVLGGILWLCLHTARLHRLSCGWPALPDSTLAVVLPKGARCASGLPSGLRELTAEGCARVDADSLPDELSVLRIQEATLCGIDRLPSHLRELDLRNIRLCDASPPQKEWIAHLPATLDALSVSADFSRNMGRLPRGLKSLRVVGRPDVVTTLEGMELPETLERLVLEGVVDWDVSRLPRSIDSLKISSNTPLPPETRAALRLLPPGLRRLDVDAVLSSALFPRPARGTPPGTGDRGETLRRLSRLRHLRLAASPRFFWREDGPDSELLTRLRTSELDLVGPDGGRGAKVERLVVPPSTVELALSGALFDSLTPEMLKAGAPRLHGLSIGASVVGTLDLRESDLERLELRRSTVRNLMSFPGRLGELTLAAMPSLAATSLPPIPPTVRVLRLLDLRFEQLPPLPPDLEELDVSRCALLARLPDLSGQRSLRILRVAGTQFPSLGVLPRSLEELDVRDSGIDATSLGKLPEGLRRIALSPEVLARIRLPRTLEVVRLDSSL